MQHTLLLHYYSMTLNNNLIFLLYSPPPPHFHSLSLYIYLLLVLIDSCVKQFINIWTYIYIYIYIWVFLMLFWSPYRNLTLKLSCFLSIFSLHYWITVQKIFLQLFSCYICEITCINNFLSCWVSSDYGYIRQALWISHKYQLRGVRCFLPKSFWRKYFHVSIQGMPFSF